MKFIRLLFLVNLLFILNIIAQDTTTTASQYDEGSFLNRDKNWEIVIPIWIPGYRGNYTYGDVSLEGEDGIDPGTPGQPIEPPPPSEPPIDGGDILSRLFNSSKYLKFFFMGGVAYIKDDFLIALDTFSGSAGSSIDFKLNNREVATADYFTFLTRLIIGYSLYELENKSKSARLTVYGYTGFRAHYIELTSNLNRTTNKLNVSNFWGEILLGLKNRIALDDWLFLLQGDIGGFNKGSNYSYLIQAFISYRISNLLSVKLGWTDWDVKYRGKVKDEELSLNVHLSGPNIGLTFHL